jgi:adenine/guanine phosphoribosyltransferase-like PRPP-binding protein
MAAMTPHDAWQTIHPPGAVSTTAPFTDYFPAQFDDGRQLLLPLRPLADGEHALASLIINQASFTVLAAIAQDLAAKLRPFAPDIVVGLPTLGLTLAAAIAEQLGHNRYIPLGTSKKFWYLENLSVPLSSITSPGAEKRLYIDPRMLPLLAGRRIALVDDVVSTGASLNAALALLSLCGHTPTCIGTAMLQSERWKPSLPAASQIATVLKTPIFKKTAAGYDVKESASFLKKRSKKLLLLWDLARLVPQPAGAKIFFASFCLQKEDLI